MKCFKSFIVAVILLHSFFCFAAPPHQVNHYTWLLDKGFIADPDAEYYENISAREVAVVLSRLKGKKISLAGSAEMSRAEFYHKLGQALTKHVVVAHTNDIHGHIAENKRNQEFGYAKLATIIKKWRSEHKNFLLLDAGDTFQGSVYADQFKGESIVPLVNYLDYDVMAAGNHEFDYGWQQTLKLKRMLNFPLISANVYRSNGKLLLTPVYYANIGGERFAFLGFVTQETSILTHAKNVAGLEFKDPVALAQELVPKLKQKVDHVIVVSHVGIQVDRKIAKSVKGIDVIIGGHTQVPLWAPEFINGTFIVQDWEYGKTLGRLDMFYFDKELVAFEGGLLRYDPKITADKKMSQLVDKVSNKVDQVMNEVIAKTAVDLEGKRSIVRTQETNLGNLVADILLERAQKIKGHAADIMLTNSGGIRTRIAAGDISKKDLFNLMPFPNTLVIVEVSGKDLLAALENGVSRINDEEPAGRFPQVAGMSFAFDKSKPASKRIVWAKVKGEPVRDQQTYKLATSDFLAAGGDGYATLKRPHYDTGLTIYAILEEAIMARRVLNPQVEGRIVQIK